MGYGIGSQWECRVGSQYSYQLEFVGAQVGSGVGSELGLRVGAQLGFSVESHSSWICAAAWPGSALVWEAQMEWDMFLSSQVTLVGILPRELFAEG